MKSILISLATWFVFIGLAHAGHENTVTQILAKNEAPDGVVIEIVSRQNDFLDWALPEAQKQARRLREKFPTLDIAIVTHGREQFALMTEKKNEKTKVHSLVERLGTQDNITVHVCGTLAERKNVSASEFPSYVDVSPAGPAQINDYLKLGYVLVKIKPH